MFVRNIDRTVKLVKDSHMTFIGPKAPLSDDFEKYEDGALLADGFAVFGNN